jgi:hypothetical protein
VHERQIHMKTISGWQLGSLKARRGPLRARHIVGADRHFSSSGMLVNCASLLRIFRKVDCQYDRKDQNVIFPCRCLHSVGVSQRNPLL